MEAGSPNQTLYINNINEKINKKVLKKMLYMVFAQHGRIAQIVACKGLKLRGQAWIVFQDVNAAISALNAKQGFNFYDKPLKIAFAKENSNAVRTKQLIAMAANTKGNSSSGASKRGRDTDADEASLPPSKERATGSNHQ